VPGRWLRARFFGTCSAGTRPLSRHGPGRPGTKKDPACCWQKQIINVQGNLWSGAPRWRRVARLWHWTGWCAIVFALSTAHRIHRGHGPCRRQSHSCQLSRLSGCALQRRFNGERAAPQKFPAATDTRGTSAVDAKGESRQVMKRLGSVAGSVFFGPQVEVPSLEHQQQPIDHSLYPGI
jgi:hypothetical protein